MGSTSPVAAPSCAPAPNANPIAMIESACMMLDFIDENEIAGKIRNAVAKTINERTVQTYDMRKMKGSADALKNGAASTHQMADEIINNL